MSSRTAGIYARQSLDRSGEGLAVTRQLDDCRKLAEGKRWTVVGTWVDNDVSASDGRRRPAYNELMDAVRTGRVDTIVAWAPDRLARRPRDLEDLLDLVEHHGVTLATVSGGDVDLSTPYGRSVARIFSAISRQESEQKGARQVRANRQRAEKGQTPWSRRPFGYNLDVNNKITIVPAEADALRFAAERVLAGDSLASTVRGLTNKGISTSAGMPFTVTGLRRALLNPRVSGKAIHQGEVVGAASWDAILDDETQSRLLARLKDPARRTTNSTSHKHWLSGIVRCGRCGDAMFASPMGLPGSYYLTYRCHKAHLSRRLDLVDDVVEGQLLARLARPDVASLLAGEGPDADRLLEESNRLRQRLDELAGLLADGTLPVASVRKASATLRTQLEDVERQRASIDNTGELAALVSTDDVINTWVGLPLRAKRTVVDLLLTATILPAGKGARFSPDQVKVAWKP